MTLLPRLELDTSKVQGLYHTYHAFNTSDPWTFTYQSTNCSISPIEEPVHKSSCTPPPDNSQGPDDSQASVHRCMTTRHLGSAVGLGIARQYIEQSQYVNARQTTHQTPLSSLSTTSPLTYTVTINKCIGTDTFSEYYLGNLSVNTNSTLMPVIAQVYEEAEGPEHTSSVMARLTALQGTTIQRFFGLWQGECCIGTNLERTVYVLLLEDIPVTVERLEDADYYLEPQVLRWHEAMQEAYDALHDSGAVHQALNLFTLGLRGVTEEDLNSGKMIDPATTQICLLDLSGAMDERDEGFNFAISGERHWSEGMVAAMRKKQQMAKESN